MYKDVISVSSGAPFQKIYKIITELEKIKIWEPSHGLPMIRHEWIPSEGILKIGSIIKVKSILWTFIAKCIWLGGNEVKWEFIEGPLKGTESWSVEPTENGCRIVKFLEYEVPNFRDRLLWELFGREIHSWASSRQLKSIKNLAENKGKNAATATNSRLKQNR